MRLEAKHGWFKDYRWKNFTNLPYSLAEKHQLYLAHNMTTTDGHPSIMFIYKGDVIKEGESVIPVELHPDVLNATPNRFHGETLFYKTDAVEIDCLSMYQMQHCWFQRLKKKGPFLQVYANFCAVKISSCLF